MNTDKYNYYIGNEPNFQSILDWENISFDVEFITDKPVDNSQYYESLLKPIAGMDLEKDFLNDLKGITQALY